MEQSAFCQEVIRSRIKDKMAHDAPIHGDIETFHAHGIRASGCGDTKRHQSSFDSQDAAAVLASLNDMTFALHHLRAAQGLASERVWTIRRLPALSGYDLDLLCEELTRRDMVVTWASATGSNVGVPVHASGVFDNKQNALIV